ncbi:hypothetical protein Mag101_01005 [Microbulbifer agarilyticus]|uniref:DUF2256 domain-containing protein n=1 Tax=Microbulbifer agarilyticus TaxID=260552 RepID=A0A1Q2M2C2_9GAMM|nr:DUF2256 domain-containing protein [Microbulbifer agarilyticus]AQQ66382.1 hypothetical protein Mag101_01005 [Microbulbifer agarilyticus]
MTRKNALPEKTCPVCGRPFTWRRKWKRCWHEVRYCSERCRRQRRRSETKTIDEKQKRRLNEAGLVSQ